MIMEHFFSKSGVNFTKIMIPTRDFAKFVKVVFLWKNEFANVSLLIRRLTEI